MAKSLARGRWWIAASAFTATVITSWLVISAPTRWQSSAQLEVDENAATPHQIMALARSGSTTRRLSENSSLTARLGHREAGEPVAARLARLLADRIRVSSGDGSTVWITAWDEDGDHARDLLEALLAASAAEDRARRQMLANTRLSDLEAERHRIIAQLDGLAHLQATPSDDRRRWPGVIGTEVELARIRLAADRLAEVEQALDQQRADALDPPQSWRVVEGPSAWERPLPRRLGVPVVLAATLPIAVTCLLWLVHDGRRSN